ncbi:MAG: hypothetical protein Ct9H90mP8_1010 [Pseudomonadota bacterium]|nr:MAG: hypothetical protein Ct9H90mP8_1010 [Pseudomonadota bacterium]
MIDFPRQNFKLGFEVVSTVFFYVALPFTQTSGSPGDAGEKRWWKKPFEFTFIRPLGQFDVWEKTTFFFGKRRFLKKNDEIETHF